MIIQGQVGPLATTASLAAGQQPNARFGNMGDVIVSELHGRYYEGTYRRARFNAANQTGVVTTVGLATTYTGLVLSNPINSTVNLVLEKVGLAFVVAWPAAAGVGLMCGYNSGTNVTHSVAGTPRSSFFGAGATGQGLVDTGATLPTAPFVTHSFGAAIGTTLVAVSLAPGLFDLEGSVILPPGAYAAPFTSTVSGAASMFASFAWEEVPL